jgi:hypothetical protein
MSRTSLLALLLTTIATVPLAASREPSPPDLANYAVLGEAGVVLGAGVRVDSGSTGALSGPVRLGARVRISGSVAGDTIFLGAGVRSTPLFCRQVVVAFSSAASRASVPTCNALPNPLVDPALLPPVSGLVAGGADVQVPRRAGTSVTAGSYGDIRVGAGGLLNLGGGTYTVQSIRVAPRGQLVCTDACTISVADRIIVRHLGHLGIAPAQQAQKMRVDIQASGGLALRAAAEGTLDATFYAPGGDIRLGPKGTYRGAYIGRTVRVGAHSQVTGDSALSSTTSTTTSTSTTSTTTPISTTTTSTSTTTSTT